MMVQDGSKLRSTGESPSQAGPSRIPLSPSISTLKSEIASESNKNQSITNNSDTKAEIDIPDGYMLIPSTGVEFFEYRRTLFFASLPFPSTPSADTLPTHYIVPSIIPHPKPSPSPPPSTKLTTDKGKGRKNDLETMLSVPGAEELESTWNRGVGVIVRHLHDGRKLNNPLKLGLVIKILRASWIQDGTWPKDDSGKPVKPPDSPLIQGTELFPLDQQDIYPPPNFNDRQ